MPPPEENNVILPNWLNKTYLEAALQQYENHKIINIQNYNVKLATAKGENFASILFRINICYSFNINTDDDNDDDDECKNQIIKKNEHFIIKTSYEDKFACTILNEFNVYEKEMEIYDMILPKMKKLLKMANINSNFCPNAIFISYPTKSIIFEDLAIKGYRMPSSINGLDIKHAQLLLNALAKYHAAGAVLLQRQPNDDIFKFYNGMLSRNTTAFTTFYLTSFDTLIQLISEWNDMDYNYYIKKLKKLRIHLIEYGKKSFEINENSFNTLIHGDIWTNNSMFCYTNVNNVNAYGNINILCNHDEEPKNVMLLDFQFCCVASPTIDLHYFFNTSLSEELRLNHQEELIQFYHLKLTDTLNALNYTGTIPNLLNFQIQFLQTSFYGLISAFLVQPIMINENVDDADITTLHGNDENALKFKRLIFKNEKVQNNIKRLLPIFDRKGLLDL